MISLSIVSHGHSELIKSFLSDLERYCAQEKLEIILTLNIPENIPEPLTTHFPYKIIRNETPKGFGANHNYAFTQSSGDYFCVVNPDIRLTSNPFPLLIQHKSGVSAPRIIDEQGKTQDNAREFLTPLKLLKRVFTKNKGIMQDTDHPDWVAGMFMLFPRAIFENINGFDEQYFMYCEDMDLCRRLRKKHYDVIVEKNATVIHLAQRDSHKKLKFLLWHIKSLLIYFVKQYK